MLLEKLKQKQGNQNDYQFAGKLGVSHQLWQMTRTGKRDIGLVILRASLKAFPNLGRDILVFLANDADAHQTTQDGERGRFKVWCGGFIDRFWKIWRNSHEL